MRKIFYIFVILIFGISCNSKPDSNKEKLFRLFLTKFNPIELPYKLNPNKIDNRSAPITLDKKSIDKIFLKLSDHVLAEAYGYLKDTTDFYKLVYYYVGDAFYYKIAVFDKQFNKVTDAAISNEDCCVPWEPGSNYCSTTIEFNKDNTIICTDSIDNNGIDSLGYIIDSNRIIKTYVRKLKIEKNGQITVKK